MPKAPPKFVTDEWVWAYTLSTLAKKDMLTEDGDPKNYGAAGGIYKNVAKKYAIDPDAPDHLERRSVAGFKDRALLLAADSAVWMPVHGTLVATGDKCAYLLAPKSGWDTGCRDSDDGVSVRDYCEPTHRWRLQVIEDDGRQLFLNLPITTTRWLTRGNEAARELFEDKTRQMIEDIRAFQLNAERVRDAEKNADLRNYNGPDTPPNATPLLFNRPNFSFGLTLTACAKRIETLESVTCEDPTGVAG